MVEYVHKSERLLNGGDGMPNSIKDYRELIEQPWGKIFYDMIFQQLNISDEKPINILDFGAGFCVTAAHYSNSHNVTSIEPSQEMLDFKIAGNYAIINGGIECLQQFENNSFDLVICHNVLEYSDDKNLIINELSRVLKCGGKLSIVKHNLTGRIISEAVLKDNPQNALAFLNEGDNDNNMFGKRNTYTNEALINEANELGLVLKNIYGIRALFGLSSNNEIKHNKDWYKAMLELEMSVCNIDRYKNIAFFNHLIFEKL